MLMPYADFRKIATTRLSADNNLTVLQFFLQNNEMITNIEPINELTAAKSGGALSKDTVICYQRDPMKLEMHLPQPLEFFSPQLTGLEYTVPAHARHGGVAIYYPKSVMYLERA